MQVASSRLLAGVALAGLGLVVCGGPVRAQVGSADIEACRKVTSDLRRLSCYDALGKTGDGGRGGSADAVGDGGVKAPAGAAGVAVLPPAGGGAGGAAPTPAPASASADGSTGKWLVRATRDGMDNSTIHTAVLMADTGNVGLINAPGAKRPPALVIRCKEKETAVFVAFDVPVTGAEKAVPVRYRIGDTEPVAATWGTADNNEGYGFWQSSTAIAFAQKLLGQSELYVRATPANKTESEAGFKLAGIDAAIQPVRAACGW